jgi:hypothetical protein
MNARCGSGFGAARLTAPSRSYELATASDRATQAAARQAAQHVEDAAGVGAHHHRRA